MVKKKSVSLLFCHTTYMNQTPAIPLSDPYGCRGFKTPINTTPFF